MKAENEINAADLAEAAKTHAATDHVRAEGKPENVKLMDIKRWADNPREQSETTPEALEHRFGTMFKRDKAGRVVHNPKHPIIIDQNGTVIDGNGRFDYYLKLPADQQPLTLPAIRCTMTGADAIRYALDSTEGQRAKARWAHEMYVLLHHGTPATENYASWITRLAKQAPATLRTLAPRSDVAVNIVDLVKKTQGHMGKMWRVARGTPREVLERYINHLRDPKGGEKSATSIDRLDKAIKACRDDGTPITADSIVAAIDATLKEAKLAGNPRQRLSLWLESNESSVLPPALRTIADSIVAGKPAAIDGAPSPDWHTLLLAVAAMLPDTSPRTAPAKPRKGK